MHHEIDVRGLPCPQPVLLVKKAIDADVSTMEIVLDDPVAVDNVNRLAKNHGYAVEIEHRGNDIVLCVKK